MDIAVVSGAHVTTTQYMYCKYNSNQLMKIPLNSIQISQIQLDTDIAAASGAHFTTTQYMYCKYNSIQLLKTPLNSIQILKIQLDTDIAAARWSTLHCNSVQILHRAGFQP